MEWNSEYSLVSYFVEKIINPKICEADTWLIALFLISIPISAIFLKAKLSITILLTDAIGMPSFMQCWQFSWI